MRWSPLLFGMLVGCGACSDGAVTQAPVIEAPAAIEPKPATIDCDGHFRIETGFRIDQVAGIESAMARWNAYAGRDFFKVDPDARCRIVASNQIGDTPFVPPKEWLAFTDNFTGRIVVDLDRLFTIGWTSGWRFEGVLLHEFGHSAGLSHTADKVIAVMGNNPDLFSKDFTSADRAECVRVKFCR